MTLGAFRFRLVLLGLVGALLLACSGGGDNADERRRDRVRDRDDEATTTTEVASGFDLDGVPTEDQDDAIIEVALQEVEEYWAETFSEVYSDDFQPVEGGFFPYGPDRPTVPCGAPPPSYEEIAGNAFFCPNDDLIAWDTDNLTNDLLEEFGPFSLVIVMAHEYGHAIQARVPVQGPTIALEQMADCFAGSFTDWLERGESDVIDVSLGDLDKAVAGFLTLRDQVGTPSDDPSAHGSAFDRIGAFQDGLFNGAAKCAEYEDIYDNGGTTVVDIPLFFDATTLQPQLDAPFNPNAQGNIFDLSLNSLEDFWTATFPSIFDRTWDPLLPDQVIPYAPSDPSTLPECAGVDDDPEDFVDEAFFCAGEPDDPDDDFVAFDIENLMPRLYEEVGDFAVATILGQQYSFGAQAQLGTFDIDKNANLQADCFTGAWAGQLAQDTLNRTGDVLLSPGDLDEAVTSFLLLGADDEGDETGTVFERVAAFRNGFFNGLPSCATFVGGGGGESTDT